MSPGAAEEGTAGAQVLLVGVGNPMRHDDGVGPLVVAQAVQLATGTDLVEALRIASPLVAPLDLLELWTDGDELSIVVDAVRSGAAPGELSLGYLGRPERAERLCPAAGAQLVVPGEGRRPSTHGLGVPDVYAILAGLGRAPRQAALVGVEGQDFTNGEGLSPAVAVAVSAAAELVLQLLRAWTVRV